MKINFFTLIFSSIVLFSEQETEIINIRPDIKAYLNAKLNKEILLKIFNIYIFYYTHIFIYHIFF